MHIKELTPNEYNSFLLFNKYNTIYQTPEYACAMKTEGYSTYLLGLIQDDNIIGATSILVKNIHGFKYAYAPRGFLIDYNDKLLVKNFTTYIKQFLSKLDIVAIKLNPMVIKNIYDSNKELIYHNEDFNDTYNYLKQLGYYHFGFNNFFESLKPRFDSYIELDKGYISLFKNIKKNFRTKIRNAEKNGIMVYKGNINNVDDLYNFTKKKSPKNDIYFKEIYNAFSKYNNAEIYYTKLDTNIYLVECQRRYELQEQINNNLNNKLLLASNNNKIINKKILADNLLDISTKQLINATDLIKEYPNGILTSTALVLINKDTVYLYMDGYDKKYNHLNSKHLLIWKLIEKYSKLGYKRFNLGGTTNVFTTNKKYVGLNEFKLNFGSNIVEYMGDLELICNNPLYFMYHNSKSLRGLLHKNNK